MSVAVTLPVSLDDKYILESGRVYLTGTQALVRLPMMQRQRDQAAGLNTAGYISGYRGSPLGGLDYQFQRAAQHLAKRNVVFQPAINEDLAAAGLSAEQLAKLTIIHVGTHANATSAAAKVLIPTLTIMADFMGVVGGAFYSIVLLGIDE